MDIKKLQEEVNARWSQQIGNPCHRSADAAHAHLHLSKALGKVAAALNDAEHEQRPLRGDEVAKYLADLVICAARFGHGMVDLDTACAARLAEKFAAKPPAYDPLPVCPTCHCRGSSFCQNRWHERHGLAMSGQYDEPK